MPQFLDMIHIPAQPNNAGDVALEGIHVAVAHVVSLEEINGSRLRKLLEEFGYTAQAIKDRMEESPSETLIELTGDRLLLVSHDLDVITAALTTDNIIGKVGD